MEESNEEHGPEICFAAEHVRWKNSMSLATGGVWKCSKDGE